MLGDMLASFPGLPRYHVRFTRRDHCACGQRGRPVMEIESCLVICQNLLVFYSNCLLYTCATINSWLECLPREQSAVGTNPTKGSSFFLSLE